MTPASSNTARVRAAHGRRRPPRVTSDRDVLAGHLSDAAHFPGGHAVALARPETEADLAAVLASGDRMLPIGAQSSLTGGATPFGGVVISTAAFREITLLAPDLVRAGAGVTLVELDAALEAAGRWYPPLPTFRGASVGGVVATNAAGAATFKYATTRAWVEGLTIVLANGDVLDLERGAVHADAAGRLTIAGGGRTAFSIPQYRLPNVPKVSAGYYAAPGMDLIDLFIGAEGTLGVVTSATLRVLTGRPADCLAFAVFDDRERALRFVHLLRESAKHTWHSGDPSGLDIAAIEHLDHRSLELLRADRVDRAVGVPIPAGARFGVLVTIELPPGTTPAQAYEEIGDAGDPSAPATPLRRFCRLLAETGAFEDVAFAAPGDRARAEQLLALREAVPAGVNQRVARAQQHVDPRISKTAGDMIVPFEHIETLLGLYDEGFKRRGLDAAIWGHISDGNLHPNVIPRSYADCEAGRDALFDLGRAVIRLGGSPLAEHGVGRNTLKQALLRELYGDGGIEQMRQIKRALDPEWKLAPGVLLAEQH